MWIIQDIKAISAYLDRKVPIVTPFTAQVAKKYQYAWLKRKYNSQMAPKAVQWYFDRKKKECIVRPLTVDRFLKEAIADEAEYAIRSTDLEHNLCSKCKYLESSKQTFIRWDTCTRMMVNTPYPHSTTCPEWTS